MKWMGCAIPPLQLRLHFRPGRRKDKTTATATDPVDAYFQPKRFRQCMGWGNGGYCAPAMFPRLARRYRPIYFLVIERPIAPSRPLPTRPRIANTSPPMPTDRLTGNLSPPYPPSSTLSGAFHVACMSSCDTPAQSKNAGLGFHVDASFPLNLALKTHRPTVGQTWQTGRDRRSRARISNGHTKRQPFRLPFGASIATWRKSNPEWQCAFRSIITEGVRRMFA